MYIATAHYVNYLVI